MSYLEKKIQRLLCADGIIFEQEKLIQDLRNGFFRFDFYIPLMNTAIEINGEQHYHRIKFFHKSEADFSKAQERDRQKIGYCLAHNIKLYCIPYWEIDHLLCAQDIFNDNFLVKSKFHNDFVWRQKNRDKS